METNFRQGKLVDQVKMMNQYYILDIHVRVEHINFHWRKWTSKINCIVLRGRGNLIGDCPWECFTGGGGGREAIYYVYGTPIGPPTESGTRHDPQE